jgi:uncharacterized protein YecT (DUF1311 family)
MRATILCLALIPALAAAQTTPQPAPSAPRPKKVLTPDQIAFQQNLKAYNAQMDGLRAIANAALAAEMAREKAPECPNADNTVAENECLAHENDLTGANLKTFTTAVRGLLAVPYPSQPGLPDYPNGPTGHPGTPATNTAAFDAAESAWHTYAKAQCDAVDTLWRGGTIVNAVDLECSLRQSRNRLRELDTAYSVVLHPY